MQAKRQGGTALVTGASRRIGLAIVDRLAAAGFDVALHVSPRSAERGEAEAARIASHGGNAALVVGDLADTKTCARLVTTAAQKLGPLTLLINNAALFEPDDADAIDLALWERHIAVNLRAPIMLAQHFVAQSPVDRDASIVNLVDQRVLRPTPSYFSYTLSKSALWTATQTMAQAFAGRGVRVNAIGPGPVLPNVYDGEAGFAREQHNLPLRRSISPDDVAEAVLYLAGAKGVTGQMIAVDAGQHFAWRTRKEND